MKETPFIAVEGPIGAGKTTLASLLADHLQFQLLLEITEENPFLGKFYEDMDEWSFQTEMFFLCNRFKQLEDVRTGYLGKNQAVMADYHVFKNMIFARKTLSADQLHKYEQIYTILTEDLPMPNMVIYLHADLNTLTERIRLRNRAAEKQISSNYLKQLAADYKQYMQVFEQKHPDIPVIRVNTAERDFIHNGQELDKIIQQVQERLK